MSTEPAPALRSLDTGDADHVDWCLYTAVVWTPERERIPVKAVLDHPEIVVFRTGWGRPGDFGVLATIDGERVGVAFGRLFTEDEHSAGYLDETIPEIVVAVDKAHRGHGVGALLLAALAEAGAAEGFRALSLSVDDGNPAIRLYERAGYRIVEADDDIVMVRNLP